MYKLHEPITATTIDRELLTAYFESIESKLRKHSIDAKRIIILNKIHYSSKISKEMRKMTLLISSHNGKMAKRLTCSEVPINLKMNEYAARITRSINNQ